MPYGLRDTSTKPVIGTTDFTISVTNQDNNPQATPVIELVEGQKSDIQVQLYDSNGNYLSIPDNHTVSLKVTNRPLSWSITKTGTVEDEDTGLVKFSFTSSNTETVGIFDSFLYVTNSDAAIVFSCKYFLVINGGLESNGAGPIGIADIRMFLRDSNPTDNTLLMSFEFSDSEIVSAIRLCIDQFNHTFFPHTSYTPSSFPYRYPWIKGACGHLLQIASNAYARNNLKYNAGDGSVDDKNKMQEYMTLANLYTAEWREFIEVVKRDLSIKRSWGISRGV